MIFKKEHRKKISDSIKKLWQNTKYKEHMINVHKGKKISDETRKKMSKTKKGEKHWWGYKISESLKGKSKTKEHILKNRLAQLGKKLSIETRKKLSDSNKGHIPWIKGRHHTEESRRKIGESSKGEKSHFWKGGITSKNLIIKCSIEFKLWRESVFARDNWTCKKCKEKGRTLHPHHIKNFAQYPKLRFNVNNGITLCKKCHGEFHKKYGIKNNTKKQLKDFLQ